MGGPNVKWRAAEGKHLCRIASPVADLPRGPALFFCWCGLLRHAARFKQAWR
jgi:hypothetical protein